MFTRKKCQNFDARILARLSTPESTSGSVTDAMAGLMKPILSNPTTQPQQPTPSSPTSTTETPDIDSKPTSESVATKTPDEEESSQPPAKKQKKKCGVCKKKLGLTGKSNPIPPIKISKYRIYTETWRYFNSRFDLTIYSPGD